MSIDVITFGCRLNTYESEVMRGHAQAAGLNDAMIFNTCAVTAQAEKQARQAIRKARREHPHKRIIVTGCAAQITPESFAEMGEVDFVLGNAEKMDGEEWQRINSPLAGESTRSWARRWGGVGQPENYPQPPSQPSPQGGGLSTKPARSRVNDIMSVRETASHLVTAFEGRARAFIQVQNGCDHRCTFCIIPFGRGPSRSVPIGEVVSQVRALVEAGYHEVVFTGVDVSDYGKDLPGAPTLGQMIRRVLALVPELRRLRLSSIDAVEVDADLLRLIAEEERLMPHLHISVQAGDDMVLKRMKRRHSRSDILEFCAKVKSLRPDVVFGADLIAGFPTETDAMFGNSLRLVDEVALTYLHVFPYSARSGTPAARMPQVPMALRRERAARLREAGERQMARHLASRVGHTLEIIVEQDGLSGHARDFTPVRLTSALPVGSVQRVTAMRSDGERLHA